MSLTNEAWQKLLAQKITRPEEFVVEVVLPIDELLNLEFSKEEGKWMRLLTVNKTAKTKFYCALCEKFCFGIITVDNHLKGSVHKMAQLSCLDIRSPTYKNVNKNCIFCHGDKFLIHTKKPTKYNYSNDSNYVVQKARNDLIEKLETNTESVHNNKRNRRPSNEELQTKGKNGKNVEGLIGVEYVFKILKTPYDKTPNYECSLCEEILNENRMQGHITGFNHRLKYCELHYPDTIEKFKNMIGHVKYIDYFNAMSHVLSRLASAIEQHHGRSTPYVVLSSAFSKMRTDLVAHIYGYPNASQHYGPSFSNVITNKEIKNIITEGIDYMAQSNSYARFAENPEPKKFYLNSRAHDPSKRNAEFFDIRKRKRSPSPPKNGSRGHERRRSRSPKRSRNPQQQNSQQQAAVPFNDEIAVATCEIERMYREYRKNPESHPHYDEEWNAFWRRRKDQLISQGMDHRSYNYQPEWVEYFRHRLEELFNKEINDAKQDVLNRLGGYNTRKPLDTPKSFESKSANNRGFELNQYPQNQVSYPIANANSQGARPEYFNSDNKMADGKSNVVHVLRLLTALEDYLGSLGVKIMDLLSKALMLEKSCSNNYELEQQLLSFENCSLLETAVEKLKGILFAGLLDKSKLQGFNRVIQFTTDLLKYADKMGWRSLPTPSNTSSNISKTALQKIANVVVQSNGGADKFSANQQKSLSDTLMDLLSTQKNYTQSAYAGGYNQDDYNQFI